MKLIIPLIALLPYLHTSAQITELDLSINTDTVSLNDFLALFSYECPDTFNLGWYPQGPWNDVKFDGMFEMERFTPHYVIQLPNDSLAKPRISGYAHSIRQSNGQYYQLITSGLGEVAHYVQLGNYDKSFTYIDGYTLCTAGGDGGDAFAKFGYFENDTTYRFTLIKGNYEFVPPFDTIFDTDVILFDKIKR